MSRTCFEHLIEDLEQMIQVEPLENDLFRSAEASTPFVVSFWQEGSEALTWIQRKPILHVSLELLVNTLEQ